MELEFDRGLCERCGTYDCLTKCQYLRLDREGARREMAKNVIAVLEAASASFGVLGNEEKCDGNEAYMLGELGLFQELAFRNTKKFEELEVKKVLTAPLMPTT